MKINIDDEFSEILTATVLKYHIKFIKKSIKQYRKLGDPTSLDLENFRDDKEILEHLIKVYAYFTGKEL